MDGLIAATYAPMHNDGTLNLDVVPLYSEFLKENKVAGAFLNGSTGDFASLTVEERKRIVDAWATNRSGELRLVNHVGHTNLNISMELAAHAADKVDAIAALSPYYFKPPTLQSLVDYCSQIAACAPNLPFYYYHIPILTGANFLMIDFLKLASNQIPNLAGIKFTNNNLVDYSYCSHFADDAFNILFGIDEIFLASLPFGATGWVGSTYNHLAPLYHSILNAFNNNDYKLASELQTKSMLFVDTLNAMGGFNGTAKSFMKVLGVDCGPSRYPHKTLLDIELEQAKDALNSLGIMQHTGKLVRK